MFEGLASTGLHLLELLLLTGVGLLRIGGKGTHAITSYYGLRNILYGVGNTHAWYGCVLDTQLFR